MFAVILFTLTAGWVTFLSGVAIPFVTGLVTKAGAPKGAKGIITILLAILVAVLTAVVKGNGVIETQTLIDGLVTLVVSVLWLYNIHLPFGLDEYLAPKIGVGPPSFDPPEA